MKPCPWKSEAEMCDAFMDAARAVGWVPYPETCGWDILLVGDAAQVRASHGGPGVLRYGGPFPDRVMIGIQAKMRPNLDVISQAIRYAQNDDRGPHVRALLVPDEPGAFREVALACRLHIFRPARYEHGGWSGFQCIAPSVIRATASLPTLPPVVPDVRAGVPSPVTLGPWKVAAFNACRILRERGYITSADLKACGLAPSSWRGRWVQDSGVRDGRMQRLVIIPGAKLPDELYPRLAEQCAEHARGAAC